MALYSWAHAMTPEEATEAATRFPGLGLVLTSGNHEAAPDLTVAPIACVWNEAQARQVATIGPWKAALILDERNQTGPSGHYLTPEQYAAEFERIAAPLRAAGIPVFTMGLAPVGNWLQRATWSMRFDTEYHQQLPRADGRAWNPNKTRHRHIRRTLGANPGPWVLSPAPFRGWFDRLLEPVNVHQWAALAQRPDVLAVAMWCLREYQGQPQHGLLDRRGNVTSVGRAVQAALA